MQPLAGEILQYRGGGAAFNLAWTPLAAPLGPRDMVIAKRRAVGHSTLECPCLVGKSGHYELVDLLGKGKARCETDLQPNGV